MRSAWLIVLALVGAAPALATQAPDAGAAGTTVPAMRKLHAPEFKAALENARASGKFTLVDVREPNETAVESYPDAVIVPLSMFDPGAIPDPQGKQVVFACRSGRRSVTASLAAQDSGYPYTCHLAGGIIAWKQAGLPTKT